MNDRRRDPARMRLPNLTEGSDLRAAAIVVLLLTVAVWALAILGAIDLVSALFGVQ